MGGNNTVNDHSFIRKLKQSCQKPFLADEKSFLFFQVYLGKIGQQNYFSAVIRFALLEEYQSFKREIVPQVILDHPFIIAPLHLLQLNSVNNINIKLFAKLQSQPLNHFMKRNQAQRQFLQKEKVIVLIYKLIKAIAAVHSTGRNHSMINSSTVFCDGNNIYLTQPVFFQKSLNSYEYLPPQIQHDLTKLKPQTKFIPKKDDIYSLGLVILELLSLQSTGDRLIRETMTMNQKTLLVQIEFVQNKYDSFIMKLILGMLSPNPQDRPTCDTLLYKLTEKYEWLRMVIIPNVKKRQISVSKDFQTMRLC